MYREDQVTTETLISALIRLQQCNKQIMQAERAQAEKSELMIEIDELYRELCEEEQDGSND